MAGLIDLLSAQSNNIELGEIQYSEGDGTYTVSIDGVNRKVYNTLNSLLSAGTRVIVNKVESGKRFIVSETGFIGNHNELKEIFRDG